jgi:hypothetical protein
MVAYISMNLKYYIKVRFLLIFLFSNCKKLQIIVGI